MTTTAAAVFRIEVHPADAADDPIGAGALHEARELGLAEGITAVRSARVYLIEAELSDEQIQRIAHELLADPISQRAAVGATAAAQGAALVEVHYLPGVMDPVAESTRETIFEMLGDVGPVSVRTGFRYDMVGAAAEQARAIAERALANTVVQRIVAEPYRPEAFERGTPYELKLTHVPIRELDDAGLKQLSRAGHLFLSLEEMRSIQQYYRDAEREPTDIELETLAQTWSEHCVHKTLKSRIRYQQIADGGSRIAQVKPTAEQWLDRPGHTRDDDGALVIDNLLKSTIAAATRRLMHDGVDWCISVFEDNAGVIKFDETDAVTFKVETHNHPSAIEPYGGAATGIGGCIRDTMGTGLAAKPIASTDVFCVAFAEGWASDEATARRRDEASSSPSSPLPKGVLHPRRVLTQIVAGVRDYGNRMGIPTVNGAVWFDDRYLGNPLVYCGSVGLIPNDKCFGEAKPGDRIIALGGRTGRDGIHGATFSSAELTDTHADEFAHAVQIGNPIAEKKMLDVILQARDRAEGCLFSAITDCGAGGFSSAIGEMGEKLGADVQLDRAPLKYAGLSYDEIWISEAQERMVLAVAPDKVDALAALCDAEDVQWCDLGRFGTENRELILRYRDTEVGRLGMDFLHDGLPQPLRQAQWAGASDAATARRRDAGAEHSSSLGGCVASSLLALLSHPNIASKHWIIRQYDHEVQGGSVVKPLVGAENDGPSDAAVVRPKLDSHKAIALSVGLATGLADIDPYWMTLAAIDEAVRNAVCVGADPSRIAILDNFCWPSSDDPRNLGSLVRAAEACYDGAIAYRTPFISGKDSLNNQFTTDDGRTIAIPPTLLISAIGIVEDARRCITMDAKRPGNTLLQVGVTTAALAGSHYAALPGAAPPGVAASAATPASPPTPPRVDLTLAPRSLATVAALIAAGHVASAHDCSDGGLLVAAAEMAFAGRVGLAVDLAGVPRDRTVDDAAACFAETPSRVLIEVAPEHYDAVARALRDAGVPFGEVGRFNDTHTLTVRSPDAGELMTETLDTLRDAWRKPLDW